MSALLTTGEVMLVLLGTSPGPLTVGKQFTASIAGAEATVAIGVARLGHSVSFAGRVGDDDAGELIRTVLAGEGIDLGRLTTDPRARTGEMRRYSRISATSVVTYHREGSAASHTTADDVLPALSEDTRIFHISGITHALNQQTAATVETLIAAARAREVTVSYDVNYRARLTSPQDAAQRLKNILGHVDILFCGEDELFLLRQATGSTDPIQAAKNAGVDQLVIKRGAAGASCHTTDHDHHCPAVQIPLLDAVGAGDAFAAGYLSAVLDNLPIPDRLTRATTTAAFSISTPGDWEGLPHHPELDLISLPPGTTIR